MSKAQDQIDAESEFMEAFISKAQENLREYLLKCYATICLKFPVSPNDRPEKHSMQMVTDFNRGLRVRFHGKDNSVVEFETDPTPITDGQMEMTL